MPKNDNSSDRELPRNLEAERAVVGSILLDNAAFFRVSGLVDVEDFSHEALFKIFQTMSAMLTRGEAVDFLTLKAAMGPKLVEAAGGSSAITALIDGIPDLGNIERYARIVADTSKLRRVIDASNRGLRKAWEGEETAEAITTEMFSSLSLVSVAQDRRARPLWEVMDVEAEKSDKRVADGLPACIPCGLPNHDQKRAIGPHLVLVIARPGHGKTAYLLNVADGIIRNNATAGVAVFSLETTAKAVVDRLIAIRTGIPLNSLKEWRWLSVEQKADISHVRECRFE